MNVIEFADIVKWYQNGEEVVAVLDHVDFRADHGEMMTIIGSSGFRKSTILNMIGLFDTPTEGTVYLDGRNVTDFSEDELTKGRRSGIGFVLRDFHLLSILTVTKSVKLPSMWDTSVNRYDHAQDLPQWVGLGDRLNHTPDQPSGGQRQRVAIARAFINKPDILLTGEPAGNLGQDTGEAILTELTRLKEDENIMIVATTYDEQVSEYTDSIVRLVDGVVTKVPGRRVSLISSGASPVSK